MLKVKYFYDESARFLEGNVNQWLMENEKFIEVIDIKFQDSQGIDGYDPFISVLIVYKKIM